MSNNVIIIPTLDPNYKLLDLVEKLQIYFKYIIIVNDGSSEDKQPIFNKLEEQQCQVIIHKENLGKGQAIKTGLKKALEIKDITGFITADSDGQHTPEDIVKISKELTRNPNSIILGTRDFNQTNVPLRSKIGNKFSSLYFRLETNKTCPDTQTGLRGIPIKYNELALNTEGSRYEYEMNFLLKAAKTNIDLKYVPIATVYENNNQGSHFRTVRDSALIYQKNLLFTMIFLVCIFIDCLGFYTLSHHGLSILISTIIARLISGLLYFLLSKKLTFDKRKKNIAPTILFICWMLISGFLVSLSANTSTSVLTVKIAVDLILFLISLLIRTQYIFKNLE